MEHNNLYSCSIGDAFEHTLRELLGCRVDLDTRRGAGKKDVYTRRIDGSSRAVEIKSNSGRIDHKNGNAYVIYLLALPDEVEVIDGRLRHYEGLYFTVPYKAFLSFLQENGYVTPVTGGYRIKTLYDRCSDGGYKWRMRAYEPLLEWLEDNKVDWLK